MACHTAGVFAHTNDCSKYYRCLKIFGLGIYKYDFTCPTNYFFDATSGICTKDQSVCKDNKFKCNATGVFADPFDNKSFYWCINNLFGGYYQSRHECRKQEVFDSIRKRCEKIADLKPGKDDDKEENASNKSSENVDSAEHDESEEDRKDKSKENSKDKSKEDKSNEDSKDKSKEKEKEFKCTEEGTFADPKQDNKYYICTYKNKEKNKFKHNHLKCDKKHVFDDEEGKCVRD